MDVLLKIDPRSKTPIFRQIIARLIEMIESGALKTGERLPASRAMADLLGVNRTTVYRAYQELWSLGYLESRPGSYTIVRQRTRVAPPQNHSSKGRIDWPDRMSPGVPEIYTTYQQDGALIERIDDNVIDFISLSPDSRLLLVDEFRKCMNAAITAEGSTLLQYGSSTGYEPLKRFIARRMCAHSISVDSDEILITTGAQSGVDLILKSILSPGDTVALEAPSYSRVIDLLRLYDYRVAQIPMRSDGLNLEVLEKRLADSAPKLLYTMPNFHNPTGITTDQAHREQLLAICEQHRLPLIEDGFEEEMKYFGKAVLPIKSMDRQKVVLYLGTFSKILFPGLRIGWIVADRSLIPRLAAVQRAAVISGNLLDQAALYRFCRTGLFERHLKRLHQIYRKRMQTAMAAMQALFDSHQFNWTRPSGGYLFWLQLKDVATSDQLLARQLMKYGVAVLPGSTHFYGSTLCGSARNRYLRLSIAHLDESAIERGIERLHSGLSCLLN